MKVFLSWSGERSKKVAEAFHYWLPMLIQSIEPWISSADIEKGERWAPAIAAQLEGCKIGIACLTSDNLDTPWLLYEGGAIAKTKDARLCTFLLDITQADVKPPLAHFQATVFEKADVRKLVEMILVRVRELKETSPTDDAFKTSFEAFWPDLESRLKAAAGETLLTVKRRPVEEILTEVLGAVRRLERERLTELREEIRREEALRKETFDQLVQREILLRLSGIEPPHLGSIGERGDSRWLGLWRESLGVPLKSGQSAASDSEGPEEPK